jgi:hypothetical protein
VTETEEAAVDAQWAEADADLIFYARGFPLAEFTDEPPTPAQRTARAALAAVVEE